MKFDLNQYRYEIGKEKVESAKYEDILEIVRENILKEHSKELSQLLQLLNKNDNEAEYNIKRLIREFLISEKISVIGYTNVQDLVSKIYDDMAGFAHIRQYIIDKDIEEINCNSYDDVEIVKSNGWEKIEPFANPQQCYDITKKMVRLGGIILNESKPYGDSFISEGIRISAMISPIIDEELGATFSIRKQSDRTFTCDEYIQYDVCTQEEIELLILCIDYDISVCVAGSTGSGKTADLNLILNNINPEKRIYVIEDSRELSLKKYDNGKVINRVINTKTISGEGKNKVNMNDLLKLALRYHPDVIVPAEMRGEEALSAVESGRTGHTVISTLHASSAQNAYFRILSMCMMGDTTLSEHMLLENIVEAFPIMVYKKQLGDMTRKIMTIFEAETIEKNIVNGRTIFEYKVENNIFEDNRIKKVIGKHVQKNKISDQIADRLLQNGAPVEKIRKFASDVWYENLRKNK